MPDDAASYDRQLTGLTNYHDGLAAEDIAAAHYLSRGLDLVARRWRGQGGEIDLIFQDDEGYVFVEVKKSRSFDEAVQHLTPRQLNRIALAAEEYIGTVADDPLTPMRLDLAMINDAGQVDTLENLTLY